MDSKDLRIGSWVNYKTENIAQEICSIQSDNTIRLKDSKGTNHGCYRMSYVEPIPLTEEWLIKFGFEKDENKPFHFIRLEEYNLEVMVNGFSGTLEKEPNWFCSIKSYAHQTTFQKMHVHQLQNLYHALTGEELTIKE